MDDWARRGGAQRPLQGACAQGGDPLARRYRSADMERCAMKSLPHHAVCLRSGVALRVT